MIQAIRPPKGAQPSSAQRTLLLPLGAERVCTRRDDAVCPHQDIEAHAALLLLGLLVGNEYRICAA